jgi:quinol monooxygenase YgiN
MPFVRLYTSAVDPGDVDEVRRLFLEDLKPAFTAQPGCLGIELAVNVEKNAGGLVEGAAVSRWESLDALDRALHSREVNEGLARIVRLLHHEPVTKIYEVLE